LTKTYLVKLSTWLYTRSSK